MFDDLLKFVFRAAEVAPAYTRSRCLAVTQSRGACSICADICPHDAITIQREVEIDGVDCSGCGLCVQACPSQALEPKVAYQPGAPVKCSRVRGEAQTVHCLGRLQPTDLLRIAGTHPEARLARGDCGDCPIGTAAVESELAAITAEAEALAALHGRPFGVTVLQTDRFDETGRSHSVSRRQLLRGGWRTVQRGAADALAPLDPGGEEEGELPAELQRSYRVIEAAEPAAETRVPWRLPRVADGCILCPICTRVCPTDAFGREFDAQGNATLFLDPERCVGCDACVAACPVDVIAMDERIEWRELSGGRSVAHAYDPNDPDAGPAGSVAR